MQLFYSQNIVGNQITLNKVESRHCIKVLRKQPGDEIEVIDGKGNWYVAEIIEANSKKCLLNVKTTKQIVKDRAYHITIAIAPTKNISRFEWFLEKATEIGVDEIIPLTSKHSERRNIKIDRLERILLSAIKQSGKATLPILNELADFKSVINKLKDKKAQKFIATCDDELTLLKKEYNAGKDVVILIGPEGDFNEAEVELAKQNGFKPISFGSSRLRTETAGVVACQSIYLLNQ